MIRADREPWAWNQAIAKPRHTCKPKSSPAGPLCNVPIRFCRPQVFGAPSYPHIPSFCVALAAFSALPLDLAQLRQCNTQLLGGAFQSIARPPVAVGPRARYLRIGRQTRGVPPYITTNGYYNTLLWPDCTLSQLRSLKMNGVDRPVTQSIAIPGSFCSGQLAADIR